MTDVDKISLNRAMQCAARLFARLPTNLQDQMRPESDDLTNFLAQVHDFAEQLVRGQDDDVGLPEYLEVDQVPVPKWLVEAGS